MAHKRKSYTQDYKKNIVEESRDAENLRVFCDSKLLPMRMVQKWREAYLDICQQTEEGNGNKRKCGSGRKPLIPELEDMIFDWVFERRAASLVVRRSDVQDYALQMASQFDLSRDDFKASKHWLDNFLQRYELSLRRSTTLFKLEDIEVIKRAILFKKFVDDIDFSKYELSNMIAMDETAIYMGQGNQTTIDHKGSTSVYVPSTGYESARVTCILAIRLDGTKVSPFIITKGKSEKITRKSGVYVLESAKAWSTQAVIQRWVDLILPSVLRCKKRGMLVWDSCSTHRAKNMKKFLSERCIDQIMIPGGMTAYLQSLDLVINKPFKDRLRNEINDYIENRMQRNVRGNFMKPGLDEIISWVVKSWNSISDSCVRNALRAGYLDKAFSFKDTLIAKHERLGPRVMKELKLQDVTNAFDTMDSYDDIPEEDEMFIIE